MIDSNYLDDCIKNKLENLKDKLEPKLTNFLSFLTTDCIKAENKEEFNSYIEDLKHNNFKIFMFVITLNEENLEKHVDKFMLQFQIEPNNKEKLTQYYLYFLEIKKLIYQSFQEK